MANPELLIVAQPTIVGTTASVVVEPIAEGSTTITFSSAGRSTQVTTTQAVCVPPAPAYTISSPQYGASGVSASLGSIFWYAPNNIYTTMETSYFQVRLIPAAGPVVESDGGYMSITTAAEPGGSATPPPGYLETTATISALAAGAAYQVQLYDLTSQCSPVYLGGSFST